MDSLELFSRLTLSAVQHLSRIAFTIIFCRDMHTGFIGRTMVQRSVMLWKKLGKDPHERS